MKILFRLAVSTIALLAAALPSWAGPLEDLSSLQKGMKSVHASFRQEKVTELLARPIKSRGEFFFGENRGVRWVYEGQMVVVYDGSTLWLHYTETDEAEKFSGIEGYSGPLSFNISELGRDYLMKAAAEPSGAIIVELTPKEKMSFVSMRMEFPEGSAFPGRVVMKEENGDETVITFVSVEFNVELRDGLFSFSPPKGVRVRVH